MDLKQALKLCHVQRWHIVATTKYQSVAEHSWAVWLIATAIYDAMFPVPHNSFERYDLQLLALTHDLPEVVMGDMPSTGKEMLKPEERDLLNSLENRIMERICIRDGAIPQTAQRGTLHERIVKLADSVEAYYFTREYIHNYEVREHVLDAMVSLYKESAKLYPSADWEAARQAVIVPLVGWPLFDEE